MCIQSQIREHFFSSFLKFSSTQKVSVPSKVSFLSDLPLSVAIVLKCRGILNLIYIEKKKVWVANKDFLSYLVSIANFRKEG